MSVIETGTRPGEEEEEEAEEDKNSASKPRFHAQECNKSFRATPPHSDFSDAITFTKIARVPTYTVIVRLPHLTISEAFNGIIR